MADANSRHGLSHVHMVGLPDGRELCYATSGSPKAIARKTILYFHGWTTSRLEAAVLSEAAASQGAMIVAIDRPGYGKSSLDPDGTFESLAEDVRQLLDHLRIGRALLVGTSGGGPYATACALLLTDRVDGLLLLSPLAPVTGREDELFQGLNSQSRRAYATFGSPGGLAEGAGEALLRRFLQRLAGFAPVDVEAMASNKAAAAMLAGATEDGLCQGPAAALHDMELYCRRAWEVGLEGIACATVIWVGEEDTVTPPCMARHYHRRIPGSRLHVVPGEGHLSLMFNHAPAILSSLLPASRL